MNQPQGGLLAKHTTMPPRIQKTPHGDVTLTSRWKRDRYLLVASGKRESLRFLFPNHPNEFEKISPVTFRHDFVPAPKAITVERILRKICLEWQLSWDDNQSITESTQENDVKTSISTVGDLFDYLFEERKSTIRDTTVERDRYHLVRWRRELGEQTNLHALDEDMLIKARARMLKNISTGTANDCFGVLKTYLSWACNKGLMPHAFFKTIRRLRIPPAERNTRKWWDTQEIELAIKCAREDIQMRTAVLYVAIGSMLGLRPEEAIMLRFEDLELDSIDAISGEHRPVAHVTPHDNWLPKDGKGRDIPISKRLWEILVEFRRPKGYLLEAVVLRTKRKANAPWAYRYDPKKVWERINERVVKAGGKAITAYGMRHSFASNLLIANVSEFKVAKWLGHADTRMIHKHYGHLRSYDGDINATDGTAINN